MLSWTESPQSQRHSQQERTTMQTPRRVIDVSGCLEDVNILLGSPVRSGQRINIRLSVSPQSRLPGRLNDSTLSPSQGATDGDGAGLLNVTVELLLHILRYVPAESLGRLRRVCKGWKLIVDTHKEFLFKPHCVANGWNVPLTIDITLPTSPTSNNTNNNSVHEEGTSTALETVGTDQKEEGEADSKYGSSASDDDAPAADGVGDAETEPTQWSRIFITNYYTTKSWMSRRDACKSPWRDEKATPFQYDADTWGQLLEVSCAL
eukprot:m.186668 g.186668  ORF g.186668 m.186668 type:complete len:263 (-) comp16855_c0_seq1:133-921(-)